MKTKIIISCLIILLLTGCTTGFVIKNKQKEDTLTLGALFPLTGGLSLYGEAAQKAAALAIEEINKAGGIKGKRLVIDYQDHQCNPKTAVAIFKQLHDIKGITLFTSAACSGTVLATAPFIKNGILLGNIVTTPKITGISPLVFRNWASDAKEAKLFAELIKEKGYKKVGVIYEETDYAEGLKISLEKELANTNIDIFAEGINSESRDARTHLTKLQDKNVDVLFISPQTEIIGDIVLKQLAELSFKSDLIVNDNIIKSKALTEKYKELLEEVFSADFVLESTPEAGNMLKRYKEKHNKPCPQENICVVVYDAIYLLTEAIDNVGEDPIKIKNYLNTVQYQGISGTIGFDEFNDRKNANYSLFTMKNGKVMQVQTN